MENLKISLKELQEEFEKIIKPQLEEILNKLNKIQQSNITNIIEAASAKIIKDISDKIDNCDCFEKYINEIKNVNKQDQEIISYPNTGLSKYSYPNFNVGNTELGSSVDPNSMVWPFGLSKK